MLTFNTKLLLKTDTGYEPVTVVSRNHKPNETTIFVCDRDAKSKRVKVANLLTIEQYKTIKDAEKVSIELSDPKAVCARLIELRTPEAIKELCDRLCEFLFGHKHFEPKSRSNKLSPYSKLLRGIPDLVIGENAYAQTRQNGEEWTRHLYFQYCGLADTDWRDINAKATAKVIDKLQNQEAIDADRYEQTIAQLLNSSSEASIGAGLIAASGRRPVEVFLQGEFEVNADGLMFAGQAKKRAEFPAYKIPLVGCTPELWLAKLAEFRAGSICQRVRLAQQKKGIHPSDESYPKAFTDAVRITVDRQGVKVAFSWLSESSVSCSRLRDAYLSVAELRYKPDSVFGLFYQAELAGHEIAKAVASMPTLNYQQFRAVEKNKQDFVVDLREVERAVAERGKEEQLVTMGLPASQPKQSPSLSELNILPAKQCGLSISFGWTAQYLPAKSVTRRVWKDSHAQKFIKAFERGDRIIALDKDKRYGGKQIGVCQLLCAPYKEKLADMPDSDLLAEGGMCGSITEFIKKYFDGDGDRKVWVIRFKFDAISAIRSDSATPITRIEEKPPNDSVSAYAPKENISQIIQATGTPVNGRHELDFYETPAWMTLLALANVPLSGVIGEVCAGHGAIASILQMAGLKIWTNDIDTNKSADYHIDATNVNKWKHLPPADWIVTNPPYSDKSAPIIQAAYSHAKRGIVMLLRQDWDEGCGDRLAFLKAHPPTTKITVPRYCFRKGKNGKWATDDDPVCIYVWDKKAKMQGFTRPIWLGTENIPLYHRTPDTAPSIEAIDVEVKRIVKEQKATEFDIYQKKSEQEVDEIMQAFIEYNKGLPRYRRWFISISIVEACCKPIRREAAAKWHSENSSIVSRMNQGLSLVHNRLRTFDWEFKQ